MNTKTNGIYAQNLGHGHTFRDGTVISVSPAFMERGSLMVAVTYNAPGVLGGLVQHVEHVLALTLVPQV